MKRGSLLMSIIVCGGILLSKNVIADQVTTKSVGETHLQLCLEYYNKGEYEKALNDCNQAIRFQAGAFAYYLRGRIYNDLNKLDNALTDYTEAINVLSKDQEQRQNFLTNILNRIIKEKNDMQVTGDIYLSRANLYYDRQEYSNAIADYTESIGIHPEYVNDFGCLPQYLYRGKSYFFMKEYTKAITDYTTALEILSSKSGGEQKDFMKNFCHSEFYFGRGLAYSANKEYDKAIAEYAELIKNGGLHSNLATNELAWLLATCQDEQYRNGEAAVELAKIIVEREPKNAAWRNTLAAAYAEVGSFDEAIQTQEEAMKLLEKDDPAYVEHLNAYKAHHAWRDIQ